MPDPPVLNDLAMAHAGVDGCVPPPPPARADIDALIRRADAHPLGVKFLAGGALDAVAATFQVHAYLVDAARDRLREAPPPAIVQVGAPGVRGRA